MRWVRRFSKIFAVLAVALLVVVTGASDRLVFMHVLKLYTQEPDTRLAMPLEDVRKRDCRHMAGATADTQA